MPVNDSPEAYAEAYGWKFEEIKPGVFSLTVPSWAGDHVHSDNTPKSRQALYKFVVDCMEKASGGSELILDVRGNRGGDVILWQPIIQALMQQKAHVTGLIQLNQEAAGVYSTYRNLSTEESLAAKNHRDYLNYAYMADDPNLDPDVKTAIQLAQSHLLETGLVTNERISQDPRFSKLLYVTTEKKGARTFNGKVSLVEDRYSFSANDTFVAAVRAVLPEERLTVYGERPESGSGTAGHMALKNSKLSVPSGTFVSYNVHGRSFETDFEQPDVRLQLPLTSFFERDSWFRKRLFEEFCDAQATASVAPGR